MQSDGQDLTRSAAHVLLGSGAREQPIGQPVRHLRRAADDEVGEVAADRRSPEVVVDVAGEVHCEGWLDDVLDPLGEPALHIPDTVEDRPHHFRPQRGILSEVRLVLDRRARQSRAVRVVRRAVSGARVHRQERQPRQRHSDGRRDIESRVAIVGDNDTVTDRAIGEHCVLSVRGRVNGRIEQALGRVVDADARGAAVDL